MLESYWNLEEGLKLLLPKAQQIAQLETVHWDDREHERKMLSLSLIEMVLKVSFRVWGEFKSFV